MKDFLKNQKENIIKIGNLENNYFLDQANFLMIMIGHSKKLMGNGLILQMIQLITMINIQEIIHNLLIFGEQTILDI